MILYLTHGNGEESIPLELPTASSQVDEIDIRLDDICSGEGNFRISDVKSSVKGLWQFIRIWTMSQLSLIMLIRFFLLKTNRS